MFMLLTLKKNPPFLSLHMQMREQAAIVVNGRKRGITAPAIYMIHIAENR